MANIDITDQGGGGGTPINTGVLQLENGVALDTTLRYVTDQTNTKSQLLLATNATTVEGTLKVKTDNVEYLDVEDGSGNNRFTISRPALGQKVTLDFASNPVGSTTIVGSIRTYTDGTNLNDIVQFREDGQTTFVERVNVEADSLVTTQTSSVIASTTTNANLVIAPNGTGALVANIPDGSAGGNARGANAVDLQISRGAATQIASGVNSVIGGGSSNTASGARSTIAGGLSNNAWGNQSFVGGGQSNSSQDNYAVVAGGQSNTAATSYCTISGGQSNTASTGTHATVVGGQGNTSSGAHSVSGGSGNTASGGTSLSIGLNNIASTESSIAIGRGNTAAGTRRTYAIGENNTVTGVDGSAALGQSNNVSGIDTSIAIGRLNTISGTTSFGFGNGNSISGNESYAFGRSNSIGSGLSIALGSGNNVNVTPANSSMVAIGFNHKTSGPFSTSIGNRSWAYLYGQIAHAAEWFSVANDWGNAQQSTLLARREATLTSGATTVLSLDGTGVTNLIIPLDTRSWNVKINYVAIVRSITGIATGVNVGDTKSQNIEIGFKKVGGTSSVVGSGSYSIAQEDASMNTATLVPTAGGSQQLALTFTAPTFAGGGSIICRVVAKIELVEVAWV